MAIKINEIPPDGLTVELSQKLDLFDKGVPETECTAALRILPSGKGIIHISGRVRSSVKLECSRCLEIYDFDIDTDLDIDVAPAGSLDSAPEHELVTGELDLEFPLRLH